MTLTLRPLRPTDETAARRLHTELAEEGFDFLLVGEDENKFSYAAVIETFDKEASGIDLEPGRVPATFLVAEVDGELVGRASIRHRLNDFLQQAGGHVGYAVSPRFRRLGYATQILRQSANWLHGRGVENVLVTCDDDNAGSAKVIEACGGQLENIVQSDEGPAKRRYWIRRGESGIQS